RVTGLTIMGNAVGAGIFFESNVQAFRVDHCTFDQCTLRAFEAIGLDIFGVVDHCTFHNNNISFEYDGDNDKSWAEPSWLGTTNCIDIEDCAFNYDDSSPLTGLDQIFYNGQGARTLMRHCTITSTSKQNVETWDSHGNNSYVTDPNTGAPTNLDMRGTIWT